MTGTEVAMRIDITEPIDADRVSLFAEQLDGATTAYVSEAPGVL